MRQHIEKLHEERLNTWEQAKALLDTAETDKRNLTTDEEQTYQRLNDRMSEIDQRVSQLVEDEQRAKASEQAFSELLATAPAPQAQQRSDTPSEELRTFLAGRSGRTWEINPEQRDLLKSPATAGGNTVPVSFYGKLVEHLIEVSGVLAAKPTELTTDGGEDLQVPKTTAHSTSAGIVTEGGALPEADPAFGQDTLKAYKYGFMLQMSRELVEDTGIDLEGYVAQQAGRAVGNGIGAHLVTGTGTAQPQGVVTGSTLGKTGGTGVAGAFTADDLMDLFYSVIAPYRNSPSCAWLMRDATVATLRKLKDTTGQYIWQPGLVAGAPDTLLGKPLYTDPNVAAVATTAKSVLFGDFSTYFVRRVNTIRFERSDDFAFGNDLISYRILLRADGRLIDTTGAIKHFAGAAT